MSVEPGLQANVSSVLRAVAPGGEWVRRGGRPGGLALGFSAGLMGGQFTPKKRMETEKLVSYAGGQWDRDKHSVLQR